MKNQLTDEVISLIDWREFFRFWKFNEKFPEILQNAEAKKLFDDANNLLKTMHDFGEAKIEWFPAKSVGDDIIIQTTPSGADAPDTPSQMKGNLTSVTALNSPLLAKEWMPKADGVVLRCFRQQTKKHDGSPYYCLADFVEDKIGLFAVTMGNNFEQTDDMYNNLLWLSISERLVEAFSQFYQKKNNALAFAIGYPSLPDLRVMKIADEILDLKSIGITLNESCMMSPISSVCGFYIIHPKARYFAVGKISDEQYDDYAKRGNESVDEVKKWVKL